MKKVIVKKQAEEKIRYFFPWIYRNEIKKIPDVQPGEIVLLYGTDGSFLGTGYINPGSVITVRILSFFKKEDINREFFRKRIYQSLKKRESLKSFTNAYRLIHSEGDFLPGLIVDYYGGFLSIQINTAGMERYRNEILEVLIELLNPRGIYEKSDVKSREKEGLTTREGVLYGDIPENITIKENDVFFYVNLKESQKTGFYLDQRKNRQVVSSYVQKDFKVLDLFSNTGGFGIYAFKKGASFVRFVDISPKAVKQLKENCLLNNLTNYQIIQEDVFDFLKEEQKKKNMYNLIILDPPPFAKTKKEKSGALRGFKYLILNSLKLLDEGGYLAAFSCSHHVDMEDLKNISLEASKDTKIPVEVVEHLYQDIDHPYILNVPASLYLKGIFLKKLSF
jgi:23S rRNA (cytosine1962-C5)-methyltransferase